MISLSRSSVTIISINNLVEKSFLTDISQHDFVRTLNNERVIKAEIRELVENTRRGRASYHEPVSFTFTFIFTLSSFYGENL